MLKQSPSRNQRSKGFKVKHVLQIFLLLAICVWLLYQMKHSHDKKKAYEEENSAEVMGKLQSGGELRLGRRDLRPLVKDTSFGVEKRERKEEEEAEEEGVSGADDEIDVRDRERTEEEDLIDEEDRERDELGSEEDKEIDLEDVNLLEDQDELEEGKSDLQETKEEHYKEDIDDVESDVVRDIQGISRSLRKVEVEKVESVNDGAEKGSETYYPENSETMHSKLMNGSMLFLVKDTAFLNGTKSYLQTEVEERSEDSRAESVGTYSDSTLSMVDNSDSDGSLSRTLQVDAVAVAGKIPSTTTTAENEIPSGESETNGGLYSGKESSMASKTKGNLDAVDDEEEEEKLIDSSELSLSEEDQEGNSVMDGL